MPEYDHNTMLSYLNYLKATGQFDKKRPFYDKVVTTITLFEPFRKYRFENQYQIDLARYLQNEYPDAEIEKHSGHSRPDIVISGIAIEIKGPTTYEGLNSIAGKIMRYEEDYPAGIIVVLFDLKVKHDFYLDWKHKLAEKFPDVTVIKIADPI